MSKFCTLLVAMWALSALAWGTRCRPFKARGAQKMTIFGLISCHSAIRNPNSWRYVMTFEMRLTAICF